MAFLWRFRIFIAGQSAPLHFSPKGSKVTLEDLLRANIVRHYLSDALLRRNAKQTIREPGDRTAHREERLVLINEAPFLESAIHTFIKRCNKPLTKEELQTWIRLAGW